MTRPGPNPGDDPTRAVPVVGEPEVPTPAGGSGTASPAGHASWLQRIPDRIGRARTSTVVLGVLFLAVFVLYVLVRPESTATTTPTTPADNEVSTNQPPAATTAPESTAPESTAPETTAPESTSTVPATTTPSRTTTSTPAQTTETATGTSSTAEETSEAPASSTEESTSTTSVATTAAPTGTG